MKKLTAFILAFILIFSSTLIFASAEHSHEIGLYADELRTESSHSFYCQTCGVLISESHSFNENGECDCGYTKHIHQNFYLVVHESYHMSTCKDCGSTFIESHTFNEIGECDCGYSVHKHSPDAYGFTTTQHSYYCKECYAKVVEYHTIDENGKCVCGYVHPDKASVFETMIQPFKILISLCRLYTSSFVIGFKNGFEQGLETGLDSI